MSFTEKIKNRLTGLTKATGRFPLTTLFLVAAAITNIININSDMNYDTYVITFLLGALLSATGQIIYERFFTEKSVYNYIIMGISLLLATGYYLIIKDVPDFSIELSVRTAVAMFAVFIAFILIPTHKREITFNDNFLVSFKSFFISLFFSIVIWGGIALILGAIDQLLVKIDYQLFSYSATIIFFIFFPLFFLSMIPVYQEKPKTEYEKYTTVPRLLEVLISYIIIPISGVFTLILLIYIVLNIRGEFWTDNLLEPMLVSYSITILLIYILSSLLENQFAIIYRKIAPKVLVPIVVFQVIASIFKIREMGLTHGRYFVILYGIYAAIAGVVLSIVPVKKNSIIAALLIIFSIVSIVPPIDAFTISKKSQINTLEETLIKNQMLEDNKIIPKGDLQLEEKEKITTSINYLYRMDYLNDIEFIPEEFEMYKDFQNTFGFRQYDYPNKYQDTIFVNLEGNQALMIQGYDFITTTYISDEERNKEIQDVKLSYLDIEYTISSKLKNEIIYINLLDKNNIVLIEFSLKEIIDRYSTGYSSENLLTLEDATFITENEKVRMGIIVQDFYFDKLANINTYWGTVNILIDFK